MSGRPGTSQLHRISALRASSAMAAGTPRAKSPPPRFSAFHPAHVVASQSLEPCTKSYRAPAQAHISQPIVAQVAYRHRQGPEEAIKGEKKARQGGRESGARCLPPRLVPTRALRQEGGFPTRTQRLSPIPHGPAMNPGQREHRRRELLDRRISPPLEGRVQEVGLVGGNARSGGRQAGGESLCPLRVDRQVGGVAPRGAEICGGPANNRTAGAASVGACTG